MVWLNINTVCGGEEGKRVEEVLPECSNFLSKLERLRVRENEGGSNRIVVLKEILRGSQHDSRIGGPLLIFLNNDNNLAAYMDKSAFVRGLRDSATD